MDGSFTFHIPCFREEQSNISARQSANTDRWRSRLMLDTNLLWAAWKKGFDASVTRGERSPLVVTAYGHHQGIHAGSNQNVDTEVDTGLELIV
jgi:hypothetical protein